ncbi:MAG: GHKL domain-containing protein, partial [Desulfobulbaceae bacterium]|nr:GHKL domain-containing protein [Desulfobulbaceae bacterium]
HFNISVEIKYQNPNLEINRLVFERVIKNLLRNSIDAISHQDIKWIQIDSSIMGDKVSISVTDSGTGIDKEVADRIFEPFYTTKDIGAGTGLGLGLCKTLLNQIGGDVHLNEEAANTAFIIKTPYSIGKCHGAQSNNY